MWPTIQEIPTIEVSYTKNKLWVEAIRVDSSIATYEVLKEKRDINTMELYEEFKVLYLDRNNNVLGLRDLTRGTTVATLIDYKLLFSIALVSNASWIIISHNHPSWNLKPSRDDILITERIKEIWKLMGITLMDHLIITSDWFLSFADEGLI